MNTRTLITGVACVALLSVAACNRDAAPADDYATAADDTAIDAVAITEDDTPERAATATTSRPAAKAATKATPAADTATETLNTGDARTTTSGQAIPSANPTQEQIAVTRDTLSPAGASSGPTAPPPQRR